MNTSLGSHLASSEVRWEAQTSGFERGQNRNEATASGGLMSTLARIGLAILLTMALGDSAARAQEQHKRKIPGVDKLTEGPSRQAFSGTIDSVDLDLHVLEVNASEGKTMEIFPIKKSVQVATADGEKLKLDELRRGNSVIVYYEQKGDRRTVKQIVVLAATPDEEKKKKHPPS